MIIAPKHLWLVVFGFTYPTTPLHLWRLLVVPSNKAFPKKNQEAHGSQRSPEKYRLLAMNKPQQSYLYQHTGSEKGWPINIQNINITSPFRKKWPFNDIMAQWFWRRIISKSLDWHCDSGDKQVFKSYQCVFPISLLSPFGEELGSIWTIQWIALLRDTLCQVWP